MIAFFFLSYFWVFFFFRDIYLLRALWSESTTLATLCSLLLHSIFISFLWLDQLFLNFGDVIEDQVHSIKIDLAIISEIITQGW